MGLEDFGGMKREPLSEDISYACEFWIDHICAIDEDIEPILEPACLSF